MDESGSLRTMRRALESSEHADAWHDGVGRRSDSSLAGRTHVLVWSAMTFVRWHYRHGVYVRSHYRRRRPPDTAQIALIGPDVGASGGWAGGQRRAVPWGPDLGQPAAGAQVVAAAIPGHPSLSLGWDRSP